jgi:hypothetical protein
MNIMMLIPPTAGTISLVFSLLSQLPMILWLVLIATRLFRLANMGLTWKRVH